VEGASEKLSHLCLLLVPLRCSSILAGNSKHIQAIKRFDLMAFIKLMEALSLFVYSAIAKDKSIKITSPLKSIEIFDDNTRKHTHAHTRKWQTFKDTFLFMILCNDENANKIELYTFAGVFTSLGCCSLLLANCANETGNEII